eukprot:2272129-Pleurochrysis_carterae.AAC.1
MRREANAACARRLRTRYSWQSSTASMRVKRYAMPKGHDDGKRCDAHAQSHGAGSQTGRHESM